MKILELQTGLFPDAALVAQAVETLHAGNAVEKADVTRLSRDDEHGWAEVARAILAADLVVTL
ncbi:hypothetical protein [Microbaculum marinisediminis]|uniref:Uncharacterized protein n=1 Tax=Microbaculum marinisediminis TaxID=2931392 RepID=A0AAW5QS53_9HYPH|nr:hypothetical protein [Microbaculum sp. A6E488]MCT8970926.1 hypothetical protein [Microbaculum sp. A6E488]